MARDRVPQHYAAASLKPVTAPRRALILRCVPQHYAAASLKRRKLGSTVNMGGKCSAALRCGLIEAARCVTRKMLHAVVFRSITLRPH